MKTKFLTKLSKTFLIAGLLSTTVYAEDNDQILLENAWVNIGYSNAKDTMLSGATTATGKGFSSLFTNPAGLATNYAAGVYVSAVGLEHKNSIEQGSDDLATTYEIDPADIPAVGLFYKSLVIEIKPDIHNAIGLAYGLETEYGLFSVGANYVIDKTSVSTGDDPDAIDYNRRFATGDYYTAGMQWQKSFVGIEDFYALYFGFSKKGQGVQIVEGEQIGRVSPVVTRMGIGVETNMFSSTVMLSIDKTQQSWLHISDSLDTTAIGLKWMVFDGFSLAVGTSSSTYTTDVDLDSSTTMSFGLEFAAWKTNVAIAALQKEVLNNAGDVFIQENSIHADISFAF